VVNPIAAISAIQLLLENLKEYPAAAFVEQAIMQTLEKDLEGTAAGKMGYTTAQVGDLVKRYIENAS
jgi:3-isopropylmalate dehydrogenase